MILVTGGAYQGKRSFAMELAGCGDDEVYEADVLEQKTAERFCSARVVNGLQALFKEAAGRLTEEETDARMQHILQRVLDENPSLIIVCDEVGCGIVPMDARERIWREKTGRWAEWIAAKSEHVYRVISGIPMQLK